jgi:hypothetical protein
MSVRHTSAIAWEEIQKSGILGKRQRHAYNVLYEFGPLTGQELSKRMGIPGQWKRCNELKLRGVVSEVGERWCTVTGRLAIIWDVNDKLPVKPPVRITNADKIKVLEERNAELERFVKWVAEREVKPGHHVEANIAARDRARHLLQGDLFK